MLDPEIRTILKEQLVDTLEDAVLFDEMRLCRTGRADVAAVNCHLWGYEIKSDRDTLARLPLQIGYYDAVFDYSLVVTCRNHLPYVRKLVPEHWGLKLAKETGQQVVIEHVRNPRRNPNVQIEEVIKLLWKPEALRVLKTHGAAIPSSTSIKYVWQALAKLPRRKLSKAIREELKFRGRTAAD